MILPPMHTGAETARSSINLGKGVDNAVLVATEARVALANTTNFGCWKQSLTITLGSMLAIMLFIDARASGDMFAIILAAAAGSILGKGRTKKKMRHTFK